MAKQTLYDWCMEHDPTILEEWHPTLNGDLDPHTISPFGLKKKVWWICKRGHPYSSTTANRLNGWKCPYCSNHKILEGYNDLATIDPELSKEWHPTKNGNLTPKQIGAGTDKKVWWLGKCGHEWEATVVSRHNGRGCPYCCWPPRKILSGFNDLQTKKPDIAEEWHPTKNGSLLPKDVSPTYSKKVWWLGKCGHEWEATVANRVFNESGCRFCMGKEPIVGETDLLTVNPDLAKEWHPTKNKQLTPQNFSAGSEKKVWWLGKCGHEWEATIINRANGAQCPICAKEQQVSFNEKAIQFYSEQLIEDNGIAVDVETNVKPPFLERMELDVYFPDIQVAVEYDGIYWHEGKRLDVKKNKLCASNGIRLFRIREQGLVDFNDCFCIFVNPADLSSVNEGIVQFLDQLSYLLNVSNNVDVDIKRDSAKIYGLKLLAKKKNSLATLYPDLAEEWHPTLNGSLKPDLISIHSKILVWWLGKCGHEWRSSITSRINGSGCKECLRELKKNNPLKHQKEKVSRERALVESSKKSEPKEVKKIIKNPLKTGNPVLASEWHPTKNGDLTPDDVSTGSPLKVWWLGKCGHEWEAAIYSRNQGHGCIYCSNSKALAGFNDLATTNPDIAAEWDYTRNNGVVPQEVLAGSRKIYWWKCKNGHPYDARPLDRKNGDGCPYCSGHRIWVGFNDLATTHPKLSKEWHPFKNTIDIHSVSSGSRSKVWWKCKYGHEWEATVANRTHNHSGCPTCYKLGIRKRKMVDDSKQSTLEKYI